MTRRDALKLAAATSAAALATYVSAQTQPGNAASIPVYGIFELTYPGPAEGNPFTDVTLSAEFSLGHRALKVMGFYDGAGTYKIRFHAGYARSLEFPHAVESPRAQRR
jgi:hypothetical protein